MNLAMPLAPFAALLPSRKSIAHAMRVSAICVPFIALLVAGFHHRRDLADMLKVTFANSQSKALGARVSAARTGDAPLVLRPLDPSSGFAETPVGVMLYASYTTPGRAIAACSPRHRPSISAPNAFSRWARRSGDNAPEIASPSPPNSPAFSSCGHCPDRDGPGLCVFLFRA